MSQQFTRINLHGRIGYGKTSARPIIEAEQEQDVHEPAQPVEPFDAEWDVTGSPVG